MLEGLRKENYELKGSPCYKQSSNMDTGALSQKTKQKRPTEGNTALTFTGSLDL